MPPICDRWCSEVFPKKTSQTVDIPGKERIITSVNPEDSAAERRRNFTNHRMGGERLRPQDVPTHLQTVGWFWSQESIMLRDPDARPTMFSDGVHVPQFATPPAWALEPGIPCQPQTHGLTGEEAIAHMNQWDAHFNSTDAERAYRLCADCPVLSECLTSALDEEGMVGGQGRFMVRGGLLPRTRAQISAGIDITGKVRA